MTLKGLILSSGFYSKDIKNKIKNKQFKINDKPLLLEDLNSEIDYSKEAGEHISENLKDFSNLIDIDCSFDSVLKITKQRYSMLRLSKHLLYVIRFTDYNVFDKYKVKNLNGLR